jgi:hypothetical protein
MVDRDRSFKPALPCRPRICLSNTLQANRVRRDYTVSALAQAKVSFPSFMQLGRVCAATDLSLAELPTGVGNPMRLHIVPSLG